MSEKQDIISISFLGSEKRTLTAAKTRDGHYVKVGCWTGKITELAAEVTRRRSTWDADEEIQNQWEAEYSAAIKLVEQRIKWWEKADESTT